jgi:hypothetical protein
MVIGVPKEIKDHEYRVALLPSAAYQLIRRGHQVIVERGAGRGTGYADTDYEQAGAMLLDDHKAVFEKGDLIVKVKEPQPSEIKLFKPGQVLFIGKAEKDVPGILAGLGPGVLTVGDGAGFLREGGIIAFVIEGGHVRFDIDQRVAARRARSAGRRPRCRGAGPGVGGRLLARLPGLRAADGHEPGLDRLFDGHRRGRKIASTYRMDDQDHWRIVPIGWSSAAGDEIGNETTGMRRACAT